MRHAIPSVFVFLVSGLCFLVVGSFFVGLRFLHYHIGGVAMYLEKVGKSINTNIQNFVIALHKKLISLIMSIAAVCKFVNS